MRKRTYWKNGHGYLWSVMFTLVALCFTGCKDDDEQGAAAFDPNKPIVITDFTPKEGGYGSNLILYGQNFGNDLSRTRVTVGGKTAKVITVKGNSLYCTIPSKAYDGDIQLSVLDENGEVIASAEAEERFQYQKKWLVSTFIGKRYENSSDFEEKDGPFDDCGGFKDMYWFSFDPKSNFDCLYYVKHTKTVRKIDLASEYVTSFNVGENFERGFAINWTEDADQNMVISDDTGKGSSKPGGYILSRTGDNSINAGWAVALKLPNAESVNGAMVRPGSGEYYFSCYYGSEVYRLNFGETDATVGFVNPRSKAVLRMIPHPSGKYAYVMQYNQHYIARVTYDQAKGTFVNPLPMAGQDGSAGWQDGVGTKAKMNHPTQGVFVKNPNYAGQDDEYDFYFCDEGNHCVRVMTPAGRVTTYAGRGNNSTSGGYADGELRTEARFSSPLAIAYDEKRNCFYIGDNGNKVIRKIALEGSEDEEVENETKEDSENDGELSE